MLEAGESTACFVRTMWCCLHPLNRSSTCTWSVY